MANNKNLDAAKKAKKDEFYTQLSDIENELRHYKEHFRGKTVLCNCDDPKISNFFVYFVRNFAELGLKRLITTCYQSETPELFSQGSEPHGLWVEYCGGDDNNPDVRKVAATAQRFKKGNGDFRSGECIELLKQADIVVTNPPFSLFREYVKQLMKYEKKFLIIGHQNAIQTKEIFPYFMNNKIWLGYGFNGGATHFISNYEDTAVAGNHIEGMIRVSGVVWYTNMDHNRRHSPLDLFKKYTPEEYPKYDNYDAIEVSKTNDIPIDYDGCMGVPITFLDKYCPEQFEILGLTSGREEFDRRAWPIKKYINAIQINADGKHSSGGKVNTGAEIVIQGPPSGTYYIADNAPAPLRRMYTRIIIRHKK